MWLAKCGPALFSDLRTSTRSRARVVMVLLLDDFAFADVKGIQDVKRLPVCERNFRLCRDPSRLTCIVPHHFDAAERRQNARKEIQDGSSSADQRALTARWIERGPEGGIIRPRNAGDIFCS